MWLNNIWVSFLLLALLLPSVIFAGALHVNDSGIWKNPTEVHVNDSGAWKPAISVHVNESGVWKVVFQVDGHPYTFTWDVDDVTNITGYKIYLNGTLLCESTNAAARELSCDSLSETLIPEPAVFHMTMISSVDGESNPSNKIWAAAYPNWQANHAYALGEKINAGTDWAHSTWMQVTRSGTSGGSQPAWPIRKEINGTVIDNDDGTVSIPCSGHGFVSGETVTINGTENYAGVYTIPAQTDIDAIIVTATYVAEDASGYVVKNTVNDPDTGGVEWTLTNE